MSPSRLYPALILSNKNGELEGLAHLVSRPTDQKVELIGWCDNGENKGDLYLVFSSSEAREAYCTHAPELDSLKAAVWGRRQELIVIKSSYHPTCSRITPTTDGWFTSQRVGESYDHGEVDQQVAKILNTSESNSGSVVCDLLRVACAPEQRKDKSQCLWNKSRVKMPTCLTHASLGSLAFKTANSLFHGGWYPEVLESIEVGLQVLKHCGAPSSRLIAAQLLWSKWTLVLPSLEEGQKGAIQDFSNEIQAYGVAAIGNAEKLNAIAHHLKFGKWCAEAEIPGVTALAILHLNLAMNLALNKRVKPFTRHLVNAALHVLDNSPRLHPYRVWGCSGQRKGHCVLESTQPMEEKQDVSTSEQGKQAASTPGKRTQSTEPKDLSQADVNRKSCEEQPAQVCEEAPVKGPLRREQGLKQPAPQEAKAGKVSSTQEQRKEKEGGRQRRAKNKKQSQDPVQSQSK